MRCGFSRKRLASTQFESNQKADSAHWVNLGKYWQSLSASNKADSNSKGQNEYVTRKSGFDAFLGRVAWAVSQRQAHYF